MEENRETIEGLLCCLDTAVSDYKRRCKTLDDNFNDKNGRIEKKDFDDYKARHDGIDDMYAEESKKCQRNLDNLCRTIRKTQPFLFELSSEYINTSGRIPRYITIGRLHVVYENLDFYLPKTFSFPFKKPMYISDESKNKILHKVILRLLFALPIDKQEYYVFDPIGLGRTVSVFNTLFSHEALFPNKKILTSVADLKPVLKNTKEYINDLYSNVFTLDNDCTDWDSYNRWLYSRNEQRKALPYKVFIFTSVPDGMDPECFDMFKTLIEHSCQCGILVLFSFNGAILQADDMRMHRNIIELKACIDRSVPLHTVFEEDDIEKRFANLKVKNVGEKFPDDKKLTLLLHDLKEKSEAGSKDAVSFDEIMNMGKMFNCNSCKGLKVPVGYGASGNSLIELNIGDTTPHYLIGGTTGSGKSNFLHNLIISACCRYSPNELNVYLLDFKEGVEFCQYARPVLPHARLVATEADTEYGITVLKHLTEEMKSRLAVFKSSGCKDIQGYRNNYPDKLMPRVLVIIDEFQVLFANNKGNDTFRALETLLKQGRSSGIHMVLATQSIKNIDFFSALSSQLGGRVVLKCSAEDSKMLLGGLTSGNEEATKLEVPFAILNTSQGEISGNVKFMVANADNKLTPWIDKIRTECDIDGIQTDTKIFEGQSLPERPVRCYSDSDNLSITFGEVIAYNPEPFRVALKPREENNLLICGRNDKIKESLINSVVISALNSEFCDEVVYVGDNDNMISDSDSVICMQSLSEFLKANRDTLFDKRRVLITDDCKFARLDGFASYGAPTKGSDAELFLKFMENANKNGSFVVAFYNGTNSLKTYGVDKNKFGYRIGYCLSPDERKDLLDPSALSNDKIADNRAFFIDNLEIKAWFRPYRK